MDKENFDRLIAAVLTNAGLTADLLSLQQGMPLTQDTVVCNREWVLAQFNVMLEKLSKG